MQKRELHIDQLTKLFESKRGETISHNEILDLVEDPEKFLDKTKPEQMEFLILMADHLKNCPDCMEEIREKLKSE